MTTKDNVRFKVLELMEDIPNWLPEKLESLLNSGAIDFPSEDNNWTLPKMIMCALAREIEQQYEPKHMTRKEKNKINNFYAMM